MLAWSFARRGIAIRPDPLGDDEPEPIAAFHHDVFAWAGLPAPA